jgi:nucleoside diphosphate kinase
MIIGPQHGPALPDYLSAMPDKLTLYATDTYFRESWEDLNHLTQNDPSEVLHGLAMMVLKPDAVVTRAIGPTFDWLYEQGFSIVAARTFAFSRHITRSIWCYSWNVATRERKDVVDMMLAPGDSLLVLLRGPDGETDPATRLLSETKGPANPARRTPGQLRYELGTLNTLLNYLHTADEPADLVRELGVYFPAAEREAIYREALAPPPDARARAEALANGLEAEAPAEKLTRDAVLERVIARLNAHEDSDSELGVELRTELNRIATGESRDWRRTLQLIEELDLDCSPWDLIGIGTHLVQMDTPTGELLIASVSAPGVREHS